MSKRNFSHNFLSSIHFNTEIQPKSPNQSLYLESLQKNTFTFAVGLAGSGKSLLAIWQAMLELATSKGKIQKIVVVRPVISNKFGEDFGSLPGSVLEKMIPVAGSVIDNLMCFLDKETIEKLIEKGYIEFVPLSLIRGRSFNNCFVIVEEAQNVKHSSKGIYTIMSRLGLHSKMVFNGDIAQSDLRDDDSALKHAIDLLTDPSKPPLKGIGIVKLYEKVDIQRHPLLYQIMVRFNEVENNPFD